MKKEAVILIKDVSTIGETGDRVVVARGYARNYLIPNGFALPDRMHARNLMISQQAVLEKMRAQKREIAEGTKKLLEAEVLEIQAPAGDEGKLFGAVTTMTIHDLLLQKDIRVERKHIHLSQRLIHDVGEYHCNITIYQDIIAQLRFKVTAKPAAPRKKASASTASATRARRITPPTHTGEESTASTES